MLLVLILGNDFSLCVDDVGAGDALCGEEVVDGAVWLGGVGQCEVVGVPVVLYLGVCLVTGYCHKGGVVAMLLVALVECGQFALAVDAGGIEKDDDTRFVAQLG